MQPSPLQLEKYLIKQLEFAVKEDFDVHQKNLPTPRMNVEVFATPHPEEPRAYRLDLNIRSEDEFSHALPYRFNITMRGFFRVVPQYPAEQVETLTRVNGPALLYSAAREVIITLTGRGGYPPVLLPSITFIPAPATKPETTEAERVIIGRGVLRGKVNRKKSKSKSR
jgi:preprotein translocase subunit SecB